MKHRLGRCTKLAVPRKRINLCDRFYMLREVKKERDANVDFCISFIFEQKIQRPDWIPARGRASDQICACFQDATGTRRTETFIFPDMELDIILNVG